jgi:hypothetical protein
MVAIFPMQLVVRAFPVLSDKQHEMRRFVTEMHTTRAADARDFYRRSGVARETWHLQTTPAGDWVICVTQIADRPVDDAAQGYARSRHPFDQWFKEQVKLVTGVNPETAPLGPPTECIFDSEGQE